MKVKELKELLENNARDEDEVVLRSTRSGMIVDIVVKHKFTYDSGTYCRIELGEAPPEKVKLP